MPFRTVARPPVGQVAYAPTALPAHRGGPQSGLLANVGTFLSPTASGHLAVTGIGFKPKLVLLFGVGATSDNAFTDLMESFGACGEDLVQGGISIGSVHGLTTSATRRSHDVFALRLVTGDGVLLQRAQVVSLDNDGFTLDFTTVDGTARLWNYVCLGGDVEAKVIPFLQNATGLDESFAHGLSGTPDCVLGFSNDYSAVAPPFSAAQATRSIGFWDGANQQVISLYSQHGQTTTSTRRRRGQQGTIAVISTALGRWMAVASADATNVNVTYPGSGLTQFYCWLVAIKGARAQVGFFDTAGSLDPHEIACSGIRPKLFLPQIVTDVASSPGAIKTHIYSGLAVSDGVRNVGCATTERGLVTTTETRRWQNSNAMGAIALGGTNVFLATASMGDQKVIVSPTVNASATVGQGSYLILGDPK